MTSKYFMDTLFVVYKVILVIGGFNYFVYLIKTTTSLGHYSPWILHKCRIINAHQEFWS